MMSAFFSAVSGLKSQTTSLDVIANNISNVNTTGYKGQRVSFGDLLSQTLSDASGSTATNGGTNAKQIGLGVSVASTDTNMTVGSTESTGVATDVAISGQGFFVVSGGSEGKNQYTREGDMTIDESGNLTVNGYKVCGWEQYTTDSSGTKTYKTDSSVEGINVYSDSYSGNKKVMAASATTKDILSGDLDSGKTASGTALNTIGTTPTTYDQTTSATVYDAQGNSSDVSVNWKKCYVDSATNTTSWYWDTTSTTGTVTGSGYVEFDSSGKIVTTDPTNYSTTPTITVTPSSGSGTAAVTVSLDLTGITQTSSSTASVTGSADGYPSGTIQSYSIESDGTIKGTYSNGKTQSLGQIALATFTNPQGLAKDGSNLYVSTSNSGTISYATAGSNGTSALSTGCLEMSNVDLAEQFSQMMISQRAYQANSKVITTADTMLQALINMVG